LDNGLPESSFTFTSLISDTNYQTLLNDFPNCKINKEGTAIIIVGHVPSTNEIIYGKGRESLNFETSSQTILSRNRIARLSQSTPYLETQADLEEIQQIHSLVWSSGTYTYNGAQNLITPMDSVLLGKNHFIMFAIPPEHFPTVDAYKKIKSKIQEGRLAANTKGCQGLQFRSENARDLTLSKRPWFMSHLRYKTLGDLGDVRCYSRQEVNPDGKILHIFCGMSLSAH
jgi:hypothetical protein